MGSARRYLEQEGRQEQFHHMKNESVYCSLHMSVKLQLHREHSVLLVSIANIPTSHSLLVFIFKTAADRVKALISL